MTALAFLIALPLSVWTIAALFALIDGPDLATAIRRICGRILALLVFVGVFGPAGHGPLVWAFSSVAVLHLATSVLGRGLIVRKKAPTVGPTD